MIDYVMKNSLESKGQTTVLPAIFSFFSLKC